MVQVSLRTFLKSSHPCFYKTLSLLHDQFGPEIRLSLFGKKIVSLEEGSTIRELLTRQQSKFVKGKTLAEMTAMTKGLKTITEMDGAEWTTLRHAFQGEMSKDFFAQRMAVVPPIVEEAIQALQKHKTVDLQEVMNRLSFKVICKMLFSFEPDCFADLSTPFPYLANQKFLVEQLLARMTRTPLWKYLPLPNNFAVRKASAVNAAYLLEIVSQRRRVNQNAGNRTPDFLDFLLKMNISDAQLAVHMYGIIGAAFESSGAVMHWALVKLAEFPHFQMSLRNNPDLAQHILYETMRLYPPFPMIVRECREDVQLPVEIKKGEVLFQLIGRSQADQKTWGEDHAEFNPFRFLSLTPDQKLNFYPFGLGKRVCIGESMARMTLPLLLSGIVNAFECSFASKHQPEPVMRFSLGPQQPTIMHFESLEKKVYQSESLQMGVF